MAAEKRKIEYEGAEIASMLFRDARDGESIRLDEVTNSLRIDELTDSVRLEALGDLVGEGMSDDDPFEPEYASEPDHFAAAIGLSESPLLLEPMSAELADCKKELEHVLDLLRPESPASITSPLSELDELAPSDVLRERKEWSPAEDERIRNGVAVHGKQWRKIATELPGRSDDAIRNRYNRLVADNVDSPDGPAIKRQRIQQRATASEANFRAERLGWTRAEDEAILRSVTELGTKWSKVAARLPGRTEHAIRNRFARLQAGFGRLQQFAARV